MKVIKMSELQEGQSGKLLDDIPYDLWDELTEGYEDEPEVLNWVNKLFVKGIFDGEEYAFIPKGTIVKLITSNGPGGGWPVFEINGEEVDFAGDIDEFKVILQDESAEQLYGFIVLNNEVNEARLPEIIDTYNLKGFDKVRGNYVLKGTAENLYKFIDEELGLPGSLEGFIAAADQPWTRVKTITETVTDSVEEAEVVYEITNDDPRMKDFTIYENDYNIKCKKIDEDVWQVSGKEEDVIDFITDYCLDEVATKITDSTSVKDEDVKECFKLAKRKNQYDEYVIRNYRNGKYCEEGSYYTDDWDDAIGTITDLAKRMNLTLRQEGSNYIAD